jgi:hypothetical protein
VLNRFENNRKLLKACKGCTRKTAKFRPVP